MLPLFQFLLLLTDPDKCLNFIDKTELHALDEESGCVVSLRKAIKQKTEAPELIEMQPKIASQAWNLVRLRAAQNR
jgi:hypothetical protein